MLFIICVFLNWLLPRIWNGFAFIPISVIILTSFLCFTHSLSNASNMTNINLDIKNTLLLLIATCIALLYNYVFIKIEISYLWLYFVSALTYTIIHAWLLDYIFDINKPKAYNIAWVSSFIAMSVVIFLNIFIAQNYTIYTENIATICISIVLSIFFSYLILRIYKETKDILSNTLLYFFTFLINSFFYAHVQVHDMFVMFILMLYLSFIVYKKNKQKENINL